MRPLSMSARPGASRTGRPRRPPRARSAHRARSASVTLPCYSCANNRLQALRPSRSSPSARDRVPPRCSRRPVGHPRDDCPANQGAERRDRLPADRPLEVRSLVDADDSVKPRTDAGGDEVAVGRRGVVRAVRGVRPAPGTFSQARLARSEIRHCELEGLGGVAGLSGLGLLPEDILALAGLMATALGIRTLER